MSEPPTDGSPEPTEERVRLLEAMPRPILVVFVLACVAAIGISVAFIFRPPRFETVALQERRPPPRAPFAHDPVRVFPAPLPDIDIPFDPPCARVTGARPLGGVSFVRRVTESLAQICTLRGGSIPPEVARAIDGFDGATIRIAEFSRTGIESTVDFSERTIWVNLKLTRRTSPTSHLTPVLLHEAWHLANASERVTAQQELAARRAEHEACRQFIPSDDRPRWCEDARDLVSMPEADAIALLAAAGYPRAVSS